MKTKDFKPRLYQEKIFASAAKRNSLVVLPTGLGNTMIALMLAAHRGKTLFLAPTKPLCEQHMKLFETHSDGIFSILTGEVSPEERKNVEVKSVDVIFATPQTIQNDLIARRMKFDDIKLLIIDEAHRAVGDYAYVWLAKQYMELAKDPLILGLTASPGHTKEEIETIKRNLFANLILSRIDSDIDVKDYIKTKKINKIMIDLPDEFKEIKKNLERSLSMFLKPLKDIDMVKSADITKIRKTELLKLQRELVSKIGSDNSIYQAISSVTICIKIIHALEVLQTVGIQPLKTYFKKIQNDRKVKANVALASNLYFKKAMMLTYEKEIEHPKYDRLVQLLENNEKKQAIIFTQYRETAKMIVETLEKNDISSRLFIGQAGKEGMNQKEQIRVLNEFGLEVFRVLVCTSIGEEGLHIPSVDMAIFFEPVPSALRSIQRKGRVGRTKIGEIYVMITKGTSDEAYYWVAVHKERKMQETLEDMKQQKLGDFEGL
jgi:ERCC4-related helicase